MKGRFSPKSKDRREQSANSKHYNAEGADHDYLCMFLKNLNLVYIGALTSHLTNQGKDK